MPTISVIIPTYNGPAYLAEAVESVWRQTVLPQEIIVVDDCSTDGTVALVGSLIARSPVPMRLMQLEKNSGGPAKPINIGVGAASSTLICVLDQDDIFETRRLESHIERFQDDPSLALVASCCERMADHQRAQTPETMNELAARGERIVGGVRLKGSQLLRTLVIRGQVLLGYPAFTFRRSDWVRRGGVDQSFRIASDYDFLCWLCLQGTCIILDDLHYSRRLHSHNLCRDIVRLDVEILRVKTRYLPDVFGRDTSTKEAQELHQQYRGCCYWLRQGGRYSDAAKVSLLALRGFGLDASVVGDLVKLLPHKVLSKVLRWPLEGPWKLQSSTGR